MYVVVLHIEKVYSLLNDDLYVIVLHIAGEEDQVNGGFNASIVEKEKWPYHKSKTKRR